jgi:hypothetical protein
MCPCRVANNGLLHAPVKYSVIARVDKYGYVHVNTSVERRMDHVRLKTDSPEEVSVCRGSDE